MSESMGKNVDIGHCHATPPQPATALPSEVFLSSLGIVDSHFERVREKITVKSARMQIQVVTRQAVAYLWTFTGQLNISMCYNQAYHDASQVQEVLERIKKLLGKELDIDLDWL